MKSSVVVTLDEGRLVGLSNVPGGIIATVDGTGTPRPPRIVLYRGGKPTVVDLPAADGMVPCSGFNREPIVTWPRITVLGCRPGAAGAPTGVWVSDDRGSSWTAISP